MMTEEGRADIDRILLWIVCACVSIAGAEGCVRQTPNLEVRVAIRKGEESGTRVLGTRTRHAPGEKEPENTEARWVPLSEGALDACDSPGELVIEEGRLLVRFGKDDVVNHVRSMRKRVTHRGGTECYKVTLDGQGARGLETLTAANLGRMLVVTRDGKVILVTRITEVLQDYFYLLILAPPQG